MSDLTLPGVNGGLTLEETENSVLESEGLIQPTQVAVSHGASTAENSMQM